MRNLVRIVIVLLAFVAMSGCNFLLGLTGETDLLVDNIQVNTGPENQFEGLTLTFFNFGSAVQGVNFVIVYSPDRTIDASDSTIYEGWIDLESRTTTKVSIGASEIDTFMSSRSLALPTEPYVYGAIVDPGNAIAEEIETNNARGTAQIYYPTADEPLSGDPGDDGGSGDVPMDSFEFELSYSGSFTLDSANPIKLVVYDPDEWMVETDKAVWVLTADGTVSFNEADIPLQDTNGSGYVMEVIHDIGNEWTPGTLPGPDDAIGIYNEMVTDNVDFAYTGDTRIFTGGRYWIGFTHPEPPAPEFFQIDFTYGAAAPFDSGNPIRIYIYDADESIDLDDAGQWVVDTPGLYTFPEDQIPVPDTNGSGYYMEVVHDISNDAGPPSYPLGPGDTHGAYFEAVLGYIDFDYYGATEIFPVGTYTFHYDPDSYVPPTVAVDTYEMDDDPANATDIFGSDYQYHTFDEAADDDWFRVTLAAGEVLVVETFEAGMIMADTVVEIFDDTMALVATNDDKVADVDYYSYVEYVAPAAGDYYILVYEFWDTIGEYDVEFNVY